MAYELGGGNKSVEILTDFWGRREQFSYRHIILRIAPSSLQGKAWDRMEWER